MSKRNSIILICAFVFIGGIIGGIYWKYTVDSSRPAPVVLHEVKIMIPEGWDQFTIQDYLKKQELDAAGFISAVVKGDTQGVSAFIFDGKPEKSSFEGYLFPDTYFVYRENSGDQLLRKMLDNFEQKITQEMQEKIIQSGMTFYEVLTLASIIEKEVATPTDRRLVAGVFLRRLADEYRLESDATINYITRKHTTRPTAQDLANESRYNSYKYPGLPPGPISNPGLDAILAVIEPTASDYYFFLNTP
ncbi:MAG TPA: endolytic transglycosylase MltG, partial [Patescibacteria group bacterium]|nr:endolytic transglycosylase MltG [Patescibacteria group bacterium]